MRPAWLFTLNGNNGEAMPPHDLYLKLSLVGHFNLNANMIYLEGNYL